MKHLGTSYNLYDMLFFHVDITKTGISKSLPQMKHLDSSSNLRDLLFFHGIDNQRLDFPNQRSYIIKLGRCHITGCHQSWEQRRLVIYPI